ncbi:MAG: recombination mediator RecR [Longicatena sp.]|nr:recombination mediator RecR [Longicatena sp.]
MYPKSFEKLIEAYKRLPGVGQKSAERYAFSTLDWDFEDVQMMIDALTQVSTNLKKCSVCNHLSEEDLCEICKQESRDKKIICVVQTSKDVIAMEKTNEFKGTYHVLGGVINTSKGIFPEDLNIDSLIDRVETGIDEVILALDPTIDGETTSLYITSLLSNKEVNVTRLAHGLPMGGHLDYADELTLTKALQGRKKVNE